MMPTQREIAQQAGVSQMAVSLALRDSPTLPAATRQRIQKLARELGYRPDPMLSTLMRQRHAKATKAPRAKIVVLHNNSRAAGQSVSAHYATAARIARDLVDRIRLSPMAEPILLNVNVPDLPYDQIAGIEVTRLGRRHKAQPVVKGVSPRGDTVYWVGPAGAAREAGPGTDFHALERGAVSVTPLQVDLTHAGQVGAIGQWLAA